MSFTALLVPVPAADWLVLDRVAPHGISVPAHVTLVAPFAPLPELTGGILDELATLFGDVVPFTFGLGEVTQFPDGVVYLAPEPGAPFHQLTHELSRRFPEYPPYEGRFDDVVPHVTVPLLDGESGEDVARLVAGHGTMTGYAQEAQLVCSDHVTFEVVEVFPFGTAAA